MPHVPLGFRPVPEGAVGLGMIAPSDPGLSAELMTPPKRSKPVVTSEAKPRKRSMKGIKMSPKPLDIRGSDVNPYTVLGDLGI